MIYFNILVESNYPIFLSLIMSGMFFSLLIFLKFNLSDLLLVSIFFVCLCLLMWLLNIFVEGLLGNHSYFMQDGFKISFYYFLFSELMFFFSLFWFFFDSSLIPMEEIGESWLPKGVEMVQPFSIPFLNSLILLSSAITLTWVHYNFLMLKKKMLFYFFTLLLGLMFLMLQFFEYKMMIFSMSDGVYGSLFYFMTGFHGLHVFFGLLFLLMNFFLLKKNNFVMNHHLSFEFSIIYWHFVDVVWLYLFIFLYWWS
uniref:Cytochrome c oxidase subunit 3 n=1 Tax=Meloidogyne enterolobii TaxID=390850 RepID=A0A0C5AR01_MELEN|nr:cytochrome c oxidase subunit III [Meloidogyne enterolobii]AJK90851.1 cytochrome c oxidase subunit III [Meloidogyne enterolobii]